jgi:hypothetical protein
MYTVLAQINPEPMPEIESDVVQDAVNNILANSSLLGAVRVDLASLKASPHIYAKIMWGFLNEMENSNIQNDGRQITDKCDMAWLKQKLNEYTEFGNLLRRKRNRIAKSVLKMINDDRLDVTLNYRVDAAFILQLVDLVHVTRRQLECSKVYLKGLLMDPSVCFSSETASFASITKLFTLLPVFGFTKKFVSFDAATWRHVMVACGAPCPDIARRSGLPKIHSGLDVFERTLHLKKVRLHHR